MDRVELVARLAVAHGHLAPPAAAAMVTDFRQALAGAPQLLPEKWATDTGRLDAAAIATIRSRMVDSAYVCRNCNWQGTGRDLAVVKNRIFCKQCSNESIDLHGVPPLAGSGPQTMPAPAGTMGATLPDSGRLQPSGVATGAPAPPTVDAATTPGGPRPPSGATLLAIQGSGAPGTMPGASTGAQLNNLPAGAEIDGCRVEFKVGAGGMGVVYRAVDIRLDRPVAIKILNPDLLESETQVARFELEARVLARLEHPNVVQVYRLGEMQGRPYLIMQWVEGESVAERLKRQQGGVPWQQGIHLLVQAAHGLAAAHVEGIVHRDVKPDNLLVTATGLLKVADFGLAKQQQADRQLSRTGAFMGTPSYVAPEQIEGQNITPRTDVYSLGITAWQLLTGRLPFRGGTLAELLMQHARAQLPSPRDVNPAIPPEVAELIQQMGAKAPHERPASMGDVAAALQPFVDPTVAASVPGGASVPASQTHPGAGIPTAANLQYRTAEGLLGRNPAATSGRPAKPPAAAAPAAKKNGFRIEPWMIVVALLIIGGVIGQVLNSGSGEAPQTKQPDRPRNTNKKAPAENRASNPPPDRGPGQILEVDTAWSRYATRDPGQLAPRVVDEFPAEGPVRNMAGNTNFTHLLVAGRHGVIWYDVHDRQRYARFHHGADWPEPTAVFSSRVSGMALVHSGQRLAKFVYKPADLTFDYRHDQEGPHFQWLVSLPHQSPMTMAGVTASGAPVVFEVHDSDFGRVKPADTPGLPQGTMTALLPTPDGYTWAGLFEAPGQERRLAFFETRGRWVTPLATLGIAGGPPLEDMTPRQWANGNEQLLDLPVPNRLFAATVDSAWLLHARGNENTRHMLVGYPAADAPDSDDCHRVGMLVSETSATWTDVSLAWQSDPVDEAAGPIVDATMLPRGELICVAHADGRIRLLDGRSGREVHEALRPTGPAAPLAPLVLCPGPEGARLYVAEAERVKVYELYSE